MIAMQHLFRNKFKKKKWDYIQLCTVSGIQSAEHRS